MLRPWGRPEHVSSPQTTTIPGHTAKFPGHHQRMDAKLHAAILWMVLKCTKSLSQRMSAEKQVVCCTNATRPINSAAIRQGGEIPPCIRRKCHQVMRDPDCSENMSPMLWSHVGSCRIGIWIGMQMYAGTSYCRRINMNLVGDYINHSKL